MTTLALISGGYIFTSANTANTTTYIRFGSVGNLSTETNMKTIFRTGGTFSNLYVRLTANSCSANTTYTVRKNTTTNGANTVVFATTQTGELEDTTHSDTVTAGDTWDVQILPDASTTGTNTISICRVLFGDTTTTNTTTRLSVSSDVSYTATSTTYYAPIQGNFSAATTTETNVQCLQRIAGTMKNMAINISANSGNTATLQSRIDTGSGPGNGSMTISVTSGQTGVIEYTSTTDSVSTGNKYNFSFTTGSTASKSITLRSIMVDYLNTSGYTQCVCGYSEAQTTPTTTSARYNALAGRLYNLGTTEANIQMKASQNLQFSNLTIGIYANSAGSTGTFNFRKNGANGNQVSSVTANQTGFFTDTSNTDYVVTTDEINYAFSAGASSGVSYSHMSSWAVKGYKYTETETTTIADGTTPNPSRKVIRQSQPIFVHTYN